MKTLFTFSLTISLFICLFPSCEKESNVLPKPYEFEGEWIWVETTSGWSAPMNPDNLGHSISLIIDHTTYTLFLDDAASYPLSYEFKTDTIFGTPLQYLLLENGKQNYFTVDSVNLTLNDGWHDSDVWHYVRK